MEISEIRARLPLARVLSHYGWEPDARGRMRCPFHDDKTPSLQTYPDTGTVYCFAGGCPTHGRALDVIDVIKEADGCTKHEAILRAKQLAGDLPKAAAKPAASPKGVSPNRAAADGAARAAVLAKVFASMRNGVKLSPVARGYLESRGLDYRLLDAAGAAAGNNSGQMHSGVRRDEALVASCVKYGLLSETGRRSRSGGPSYRTFARGTVVFALRAQGGQIGGLYFRSVTDGGGRHFYLRDRRGLWPRWPAKATRRVLLCESVIDAASVVQHASEILGDAAGWAVLALYGTNGWTPDHTEAIDRLTRLEEVCLLLDGDGAGRRATGTYAHKIHGRRPGVQITSVELPEGQDANGLLVEGGAGALAKVVADRCEVNLAPAAVAEPTTVTAPAAPTGTEVFTSTETPSIEPAASETKSAAAAAKNEEPITPDGRGHLDESNPYDLGYGGRAARYRIKGYRLGQLDSLKVTLQIVTAPTPAA